MNPRAIVSDYWGGGGHSSWGGGFFDEIAQASLSTPIILSIHPSIHRFWSIAIAVYTANHHLTSISNLLSAIIRIY